MAWSEYLRLRNSLWHGFLDECHGACALRSRELAAIVLDSLKHFDGERYDLDSAIIMPNHVHLIAQFRPPVTCRDQCKSWLRYTAFQVNLRIGSKGVFWQSEPFDHLIRSEEQFFYLRRYIAQYGVVAKPVLILESAVKCTNVARRSASWGLLELPTRSVEPH